MWLLDRMLRKAITRGQLIVVDHTGRTYRYGMPDRAFPKPICVRLTDRQVALKIFRDARLFAGEAYMDGRLIVEQGDIRDLALLATYNAPLADNAWLRPNGVVSKAASVVGGRLDRFNWRQRSRRNAEHSYNLTRQLYELFLDEDRQYTCAYFRDGSTDLAGAPLHKKTPLPAELNV